MINKKSQSVIIGYVLLIVFAVAASVIVYNYLRSYVPEEISECPEDAALAVKDYIYDCDSGNLQDLTLTLQNKGLFNVDGFRIFGSEDPSDKIATKEFVKEAGLDYFILSPLKPGLTESKTIVNDKSVSGDNLAFVEITPLIFEDNKIKACGNAKIRQNLECAVECTTNADCDNGLFCDGTETCDTAAGVCVNGGNPCTTPDSPICNENTNSCVECAVNADCNDDIACTTDVCNANGACSNLLDDSFCDDGNACTDDFCSDITGCNNPAEPVGTQCNGNGICGGGANAKMCLQPELWLKFEGLSTFYNNYGTLGPLTQNCGLTPGPAIDTYNGKVNQTAVFDGREDCLNYGNILDIGTGSATFTFWFKPKLVPDGQSWQGGALFSKAGATATAKGYGGYIFDEGNIDNKEIGFYYGGPVSVPTDMSTPKYASSTSTWHFGALVFDRTSNQAKLYIDGSTTPFTRTLPSDATNTADEFCIGSQSIGNGCQAANFHNYYNGSLDDLRAYKGKILSPTELNIIKNQ